MRALPLVLACMLAAGALAGCASSEETTYGTGDGGRELSTDVTVEENRSGNETVDDGSSDNDSPRP